MKVMKTLISVSVLLLATTLKSQDHPQSGQPYKLEAYITTDRSHYKPGEAIRARVEPRNVGGHAILVGRELSTIENWPFSIWLRLVDSEGKYAQPVKAGFIDPPPKADLSTRDGVLRWWTTLDPGCFHGWYVDFRVGSVRPGRYKLEGDYYSTGLNTVMSEVPSPGAEQMPAFAGKVQAQPATIEVGQD